MNTDFLFENPVIVYGAGSIARVMIPYLKLNSRITLEGIAVSGDTTSAQAEFSDIPVFNAEELRNKHNSVILIATSSQYHNEISETCRKFGAEKIIPLSSQLKDEIILLFYKQYFKEKGIDLGEKTFEIKNMRFVNPLYADIPNGINMFTHIGDFILPSAYNDDRMLAEGPYEYDRVQLKSGDVVFDCGANMGVFSVYAASKGCTSFAFEPTPALKPLIQKHSELNGNLISLAEYAVSDKTGKCDFYIDEYSCGASSLLIRSSNTHKISIDQISLDEFVQKNNISKVDFIKADIEGAERLMLSGAKRILKEYAPKLSLCTYHLHDDKEVLTKLILDANPAYKIAYKWQKLYAYV